ncbi:MAG: TolB protein [Frankiales bacterium]|nr:TolB protein [Frankiales bacterium]
MGGARLAAVLSVLAIAGAACDGEQGARSVAPTVASTPAPTLTPTPKAAHHTLLAYDRWDPASHVHSIWLTDIVVGGPRRLISAAGDAPAWSPDGRELAFASNLDADCGGCTSLRVISGEGTHSRLLRSDGTNGDPAWSPDGKLIAFVHGPNVTNGPPEIDVIAPDGTGLHRLTPAKRSFGGTLTWAPDSKQLVIDTPDDGLWIIHTDGRALRRLTPAPVFADRTRPGAHARIDSQPIWSRNGKRILFTREDGTDGQPHSTIFSVDVNGGKAHRLTAPTLSADSPALSPDLSTIAFIGATSPSGCFTSALYVMSAEGGGARRISPLYRGAISSPVWSHDGRSIAYAAPPATTQCFTDSPDYDIVALEVSSRSPHTLNQGHSAWEQSYVLRQP